MLQACGFHSAISLGGKDLIAECLAGLGGVAGAQRQPERAARLLGAADALLQAIGFVQPPASRAEYDRNVAAVRAALSETAFAMHWAEGRAMTLEQAVAFALQPSEERRPAYVSGVGYPAGLTAREVEVLRLVAASLTDAQVAEKLVISPRTVTTHLTSIYRKLGITSRGEAARFAVEHGLA